MRDSAIFYRSFYDAIKDLPEDIQADVIKAMFEYAFYYNEIDLIGTAKAIFTLIKPQLDANIKKYENGKKGGRPSMEKNQTETKEKPEVNQEGTKAKGNVNESYNVSSNKNADVDENTEIGLNANANKFLKNEKVKKAFMKDFRISKEEDLVNVLKAYHLHLEKSNISFKPPKDYRSHLDNWFRKRENGKKTKEETNRRINGYTSEDVDRMYGKLNRV